MILKANSDSCLLPFTYTNIKNQRLCKFALAHTVLAPPAGPFRQWQKVPKILFFLRKLYVLTNKFFFFFFFLKALKY